MSFNFVTALLAILLAFAMMLGMVTVTASAAGNFEACGEQSITWDADAKDKITLDGDLSDWNSAGYQHHEITMDNLVLFDHVPNNTMPAGFQINTSYVADADNLYVAFYVVDDNVNTSGDLLQYGSGDSFQIAIDFNNAAKDLMESDPEYFNTISANPETIFYSFCYAEAGEILIVRQNKKGDEAEALNESLGAWGKCSKTNEGWCAEFALSWQMLYEDFTFKSFVANDYAAVIDGETPLQMGVFLSYINAIDGMGAKGAAGTFITEDCKSSDGILPTENGLTLTMEYEEGMTFNCTGIKTAIDDTPGGDDNGLGKFDSLDKLSGFSAGNVTYGFSGFNGGKLTCAPTAGEDGSVHLVASELAEGAKEIVASFDVRYFYLMSTAYTGFDGMAMKDKIELIPNKNLGDEAYRTVVLKLKRSEAVKNYEITMNYYVGPADATTGDITFAPENQVWPTAATSSDEYEYIVFELPVADYESFGTDYINTLRFTWVEDLVYEDTVPSAMTMDVYAINLYKDAAAAAADLGLTLGDAPEVPDESESESESESVSESVSETASETEENTAKETASTAESAAATETEKSGGCGSVVGVSAAAVVLSAVAAAIVLKKKED